MKHKIRIPSFISPNPKNLSEAYDSEAYDSKQE